MLVVPKYRPMAPLPSLSQTKLTLFLLLSCLASILPAALAEDQRTNEVPLVIDNRTVHVFRGALGDITPEERAAAARSHINHALEGRGEGWTSILPIGNDVVVALDGKHMFTVTTGDVPAASKESPDDLANRASRILQKVWTDSQEHRQTGFNVTAIPKVVLAVTILTVGLIVLIVTARFMRRVLTGILTRGLKNLAGAGLRYRLTGVILRFTATVSIVLLWLIGLLAIFHTLSYCFAQFALTRPFGENLQQASREMIFHGIRATAAALPGLTVAVVIFAAARLITQATKAVFDQIAAGRFHWGVLDSHTAPATRYLVNAAIWLFAVAMAYPYLPGSHTEAFKGVSVLLGVMVSIGAAGPVGQIASGLILAYTRAVLVGEYVRIQETEGTVTHLGLCVTSLRTGTGEEISLPNSLVMNSVTRNFSRHVPDHGYLIETSVTIGYDTPWREVHAMLLEAAGKITAVRREPAPYVVQTDLSDFYVGYRLVVQAASSQDWTRLQVVSDLNAAIQDVFAQHGVQIMSPHYLGDPATSKIPPSK